MTMPQIYRRGLTLQDQRQYRTGVHVNKLPTKTIGPIYPAREMEEEIHVHSCPPGWTDYGGTCFPDPLTEPSWGSGGDQSSRTRSAM